MLSPGLNWVSLGHIELGEENVRIWGRILIGGLVALGSPWAMTSAAGATPSHPGGVIDTCPEVRAGAPTGNVEKSTTPPAGSDVAPGTVINVTLRWDTARFAGPQLHKVLDCVTIDGHAADDLSVQERDSANDGEFTTRMTVPALTDGVQLCDRGFVSGPAVPGGFAREKSNDVCFTVRGDVPRPAVTVLSVTPEQAPSPAPTSPAPSTPLPGPAADTTTTTGPAALPAAESPTPPIGAPTPPTGASTPPNEVTVGANRAGHGPLGTDVAGAHDELGQPLTTLPRTGTGVATIVLFALTALLGGQLLRRAARSSRRPA